MLVRKKQVMVFYILKGVFMKELVYLDEEKFKWNDHLYKEFLDNLNSKQAFGQSRHKAKIDGTDKGKIFSIKTMETYKKATKVFCQFVNAMSNSNDKRVRHLKQTKKYVDPFIQCLIDAGASPNTISTYKSALSKVFGEDICTIDTPIRARADIKKNRRPTTALEHFSEKRNLALVEFCKSSGLRRKELLLVRPCDITASMSWSELTGKSEDFLKVNYSKKIDEFHGIFEDVYEPAPYQPLYNIYVKQGKGGKPRNVLFYAPPKLIEWIQTLPPNEPIFKSVPKNCPVHRYRREYATTMMNFFSREPDKIKNERDYYFCRKDLAGLCLDRQAMFITSKQLGHNRIDVIARNYIIPDKVFNYN